jgi:hypothetical protein
VNEGTEEGFQFPHGAGLLCSLWAFVVNFGSKFFPDNVTRFPDSDGAIQTRDWNPQAPAKNTTPIIISCAVKTGQTDAANAGVTSARIAQNSDIPIMKGHIPASMSSPTICCEEQEWIFLLSHLTKPRIAVYIYLAISS